MCKQTGPNEEATHFIGGTCNSRQANNYPISVYIIQEDSSPHQPSLFTPLLLPKSLDDRIQEDDVRTRIITNSTIQNNNYSLDERDGDNLSSSLSSWTSEAKSIFEVTLPMILTGLLIYSRSIISMLFLGRLGELALAGGSLAVGFANITGYSVLSGLALGMEPICGQAFGAQKHSLSGLTLYRTILLLLLTSLPISFLWLNMNKILLICGQDQAISSQAQLYLVYSLPDLLAQSLLHPLRIFLRSQSITLPLTITSALAIVLHFPLNWLLVETFNLGVKGVAVASVCTNFLMVLFLILYLIINSKHYSFQLGCWTQTNPLVLLSSRAELKELIGLAIPSCISVCLEWWWYEIIILLCGLLPDPKATVASMGILIQTTSLIYIFPSSLSVGLSTRVGNELGAGRPKRARRAAITGLFFSFIMGFTALSFTLMVRQKWATMFTKDMEIIRLTTLVLPIIGLCELGNCPQTTGCGVLRGTARPKVGANINLGCFYLVGMPVAVWLGFYGGCGFEGLWVGLMAAQASCVVTMMVVLNSTDWEFQAQRAKKLTSHAYPVLDLREEEEEKRKEIININSSHKNDDQLPLLV